MSILQMRKQAQEDPGWLTGLMGAGLDWGLSFRGGLPYSVSPDPKERTYWAEEGHCQCSKGYLISPACPWLRC